MTISEHVALWQNLFTGLPQNTAGEIALFLAFVFVAVAVLFSLSSDLFELRFARERQYLRRHERMPFFNYLLELFSGGIINTKIYASEAK